MKKIVGYTDTWSVFPGTTMGFKISTYGPARYRADLVRVICGDNDPSHGIFREEAIDAACNGEYPGRSQPIDAGSYCVVENRVNLDKTEDFTVYAWVFPTNPKRGVQGIVTQWDDENGSGFALMLDDNGCAAFRIGANGATSEVSSGQALAERRWCLVSGTYNAAQQTLRISQSPLDVTLDAKPPVNVEAQASGFEAANLPFMIAAFRDVLENGKAGSSCNFDGKIDNPGIASAALSDSEVTVAACRSAPRGTTASPPAAAPARASAGTARP